MTDWIARPVFHVADVGASLRFYTERLGFTSPWQHKEQGHPVVAQVERDGCALILASTWAEKAGKGTLFVSLDPQPWSKEAEAAALDALRAEFEAAGVAVREGHWGYRVVAAEDPDGNTLLFNYSN